ncbi:MAG: fold metallo-hydrolase [Naasia sp.]|jgi:L-ascorbate metabolism protein UlaG (beta-lactamase superfamily)|uniref:MBL fold metallo-hydrolase n=1 Tax=Naasia sp. TaxID=2546198 RepID=UPI002627EADF|nr:MBL fold metallo-hydrolase [Naasia sp.]MCU1570105.1 fold metallo-hydrolase [Naasia sp.]
MKVTKLEHAALLIEASGKTLLIDPGSLTTPVTEPGQAVAIVITHEHADHWSPDQLNRILSKVPRVPIYGPAGVAAAAEGFDVIVVAEGDTIEADPFTLQFFGSAHAEIHHTVPVPGNVGVLVNDRLFYPGDAFTVPGVPVDTLAVPASAPWMKLGEAMDYLAEVAPKRAFPTHDMLLSAAGRGLHNARLAEAMAAAGGEYLPLEPGQSIDI